MKVSKQSIFITMRKAKSNDSSPQKQLKALKRKIACPVYSNKESTLTGRYQHSIIVIYNSRIKLFSNVDIKSDCSFIDLSLNNLTNFTNFPSSLLNLTTLILDSNQIRSFHGIQSPNSYPKLRFLSLKKNPITQHIFFKTMCIIVFGNQLHTINGEKINENQRQSANKLRKTAIPRLIQGEIITGLNPLKFSNPLSEKSQIDHLIDHADRKSSPKIKNRKMSPKKRNLNDQSPSVGCLVNMVSSISPKQIQKVVQGQFEGENNDSKKSLLNVVIEMKQKINHLKTKFNGDGNHLLNNDVDYQITSENKFNVDEQITIEKICCQMSKEEQKFLENYELMFVDDDDKSDTKIESIYEQPKIDTNKNDQSSFKIIEDPSINNEVEMCFDYPEACPFLI